MRCLGTVKYFTLSNARRLYSSAGKLLLNKGLKAPSTWGTVCPLAAILSHPKKTSYTVPYFSEYKSHLCISRRQLFCIFLHKKIYVSRTINRSNFLEVQYTQGYWLIMYGFNVLSFFFENRLREQQKLCYKTEKNIQKESKVHYFLNVLYISLSLKPSRSSSSVTVSD